MVYAAGLRMRVAAGAVKATVEGRLGQGVSIWFRDRCQAREVCSRHAGQDPRR